MMTDSFIQGLPTTKRGWFIWNLLADINTLYRWGGQGPRGQDCSGLMVEALQAAGELRLGQDRTSRGLYADLQAENLSIPLPLPEGQALEPGTLLFWSSNGTPQGIYHVAAALTPGWMIEAGGGDSRVLTPEDADRRQAFVRVVPLRFPNYMGDPFADL